jgi:hypothetical protein
MARYSSPQSRQTIQSGPRSVGASFAVAAMALGWGRLGFFAPLRLAVCLRRPAIEGERTKHAAAAARPTPYLPIDRHGADLLFQVISGRYERGSVILTTNRAFKGWASVFNDATVADAVINRIVHNSEVVTLERKSYRLPRDHGE